MALYGTKSVSQAAALALRQLQDQLSVAYSDNAKLQQERSELRTELHSLAEAQTGELEQVEAHKAKLAQQVTEMRNMLEEMRDALETTADENFKLSKEVERSSKAGSSSKQELETCRLVCWHLAAETQRLSATATHAAFTVAC